MDDNLNNLDELDIEILSLLQQDGRKSFKEIAIELDVNAGTIRNRYNKLIEDKTLQIVGSVDPGKVGFNVFASIFIAVRPAHKLEEVLEALKLLPELSFLGLVSGELDIMLDVMCKDNDHLISLMKQHILTIEGVSHTKTQTYFQVIEWRQPNVTMLRNHVKSKNGVK